MSWFIMLYLGIHPFATSVKNKIETERKGMGKCKMETKMINNM